MRRGKPPTRISLEAQVAAAAASASASPPAPQPAWEAAAAVPPFSCDRTREFTQLMHAQRLLNKQMGDPHAHANAAAAIIQPIRQTTPFTDSAVHLLSGIRRMHDLLVSQRAEYLDLHRHLSSTSSGRRGKALTDADRDQLESEVNKTVLDIKARIDVLKDSIRPARTQAELEDEEEALAEESPAEREAYMAYERDHHNPDIRAHQHTVIILLFDALRQLTALMASLKAQRTAQLRAEVEERHPGALAMRAAHERERRQMADGGTTAAATHSGTSSADSTDMSTASLLRKAVSTSLNKIQRLDLTADDPSGGAPLAPTTDDPSAPSITFSAAEQALLLEENHHLLDSLEDQLDAMRRAESQMAGIAQLMTLFNSKVMEQEEQIGTIYDNAINSTLHVHAGISQLKKAAQRGVTFRMMILFMILILSFSLLFLDRYTN